MDKSKVFYGWWIVFASAVGIGLGTMPLVVASFSVFVKPLTADFGWARSEVAAAITFHVIGIVISAPFAGKLVDRFGARRMILISYPLCMTVLGAQYFLTHSLTHLYISYFLIAVLGSGASPVAYTKVICNWFERRRGLALGLSLSGVGLGMAIASLFSQYMVSTYGWREAYLALAVTSLVIGLPIVVLLLRDRPSDMGMSGDIKAAAGESDSFPMVGKTPREARGDSAYWMMMAGFGLVGLGYAGVSAHLMPLLTDRGLGSDIAIAAQASMGVSVVVGRLITGFLLDYIWGPRIATFAICATAIGIGILTLGPVGAWSFVGACLLGMAAGAEIDVMAVLVSRYFGTRYFATLFGQLNACFFLGTALGPIAVGMSYDMTQSYATITPAIIVILLTSAALFLFFKPYPQEFLFSHHRR